VCFDVRHGDPGSKIPHLLWNCQSPSALLLSLDFLIEERAFERRWGMEKGQNEQDEGPIERTRAFNVL